MLLIELSIGDRFRFPGKFTTYEIINRKRHPNGWPQVEYSKVKNDGTLFKKSYRHFVGYKQSSREIVPR